MRVLARFFATALIAAAASMGAAPASLAEQLFKPAARALSPLAVKDTQIIQQRSVAINETALLALVQGGRTVATTLDVQLFGGKTVLLSGLSMWATPEGGVSLKARAPGDGYAALSIANGKLVGIIETGGHSYLIDPGAGSDHVLAEINHSAYARDSHVDRPAPEPTARMAPDTAPNGRSVSTINILAAYTADARVRMMSGGATPAQIVDRDIAITNQAMAASGVPVVFNRVGLAAVSTWYDENTSDPVKPLYDITSGSNANFPAIRTMRNTVGADLVVLYIRQQPITYCGVAWVNIPPNPNYGFATVDAACTGSLTLAHEIGHTMGLHHDRHVEPNANATAYNYGYVSTYGNFRDLMSYSNRCFAVLGRDCAVKTYYSSPAKYYNGAKGGILQGTSGAADASRWLQEKRDAVSRFR